MFLSIPTFTMSVSLCYCHSFIRKWIRFSENSTWEQKTGSLPAIVQMPLCQRPEKKKKLKNCLSTKRFVLFELPLDVIVSKSLVTLLITGPRKWLNDEAEL